MKNQEIILREEKDKITIAQNLSITDSASMTQAAGLLSELNRANDRIVKDRETLTKPINESLKAIRAKYKPFVDTLESAIEIVRSKMGVYQSEALRFQKAEEAKIAARIGEGKGKLSIETAVKKIAEIDAPEARVATGSGSVSFRTVRKFEVMDIVLLPIEYHLANEAKIRKSMEAGIEVSGVRYFEEQSVINKR